MKLIFQRPETTNFLAIGSGPLILTFQLIKKPLPENDKFFGLPLNVVQNVNFLAVEVENGDFKVLKNRMRMDTDIGRTGYQFLMTYAKNEGIIHNAYLSD